MNPLRGTTARTALLLLAMALAGGLRLAAQVADPTATARQYTQWFYAGEIEKLWSHFSVELKRGLTGIDHLREFQKQALEQLGSEEKVLEEAGKEQGARFVYMRTAKFSKASAPIVVQWTLAADGATVDGFFVRPQQKEAPSNFLTYQTKTPLRLPFDGEWRVASGGRSLEENAHAFVVDQRFASDFVIVKDGSTHKADGTSNDQYYCYGQPILAPGAGTVVAAVDGVAENRPGELDPKHPLGNHVVIDHGNGEFSFLAHFKTGSVAVQPGAAVKAGDRLGACGNSGNASEPHLHYHLQTTSKALDGEGLPAQFLGYVANGKEVARGEPTKPQAIHMPSPAAATPPK